MTILLLGTRDFAAAFAHLGRRRLERVIVVGTDDAGNVLDYWESPPGTDYNVLVKPSDLCQVLSSGVTRVCLLHNHPHPSLTPSAGDVEFTRVVADMFCKLGITLVDHLIIGRGGSYFSFKGAAFAGLKGACTVNNTGV